MPENEEMLVYWHTHTRYVKETWEGNERVPNDQPETVWTNNITLDYNPTYKINICDSIVIQI